MSAWQSASVAALWDGSLDARSCVLFIPVEIGFGVSLVISQLDNKDVKEWKHGAKAS